MVRPRLTVRNQSVCIEDLPFFIGGTDELMERLSVLVVEDKSSLVVTSNVDQLVNLQSSSDLRAAYRDADLRLLDGMPLVYLSRVLGCRSVARHTGADLLPLCASVSAERGWRIVILGGAPEVSSRAAENLRIAYPKADMKSVELPHFKDVKDPNLAPIVDRLLALEPDVVFICLGSPKQEQWYLHWVDRLPSAIFIGAGAAVDFAAGSKSRAPRFLQRLGFEWIWRLCQEPSRLAHRYLVKGREFIPIVIRSLVLRRK